MFFPKMSEMLVFHSILEFPSNSLGTIRFIYSFAFLNVKIKVAKHYIKVYKRKGKVKVICGKR